MSIREWAGWMPGMRVTTDDTPAPKKASEVSVKSVREDKPQFKREYKARLPGGRSMTITARTLYGRSYSGEITQPGGRWVLFDPERVADKILDPQLVPVVMELCGEILRIDDAFVASNPAEFEDESGTVWCRR